ncbi:MAG: hypothetical protein ACLFSC_11125 [Wenzhouxiangella sp.]
MTDPTFLSAKLTEKEVNLKAGFLISVLALGATSFAHAQSYAITFDVYYSGSQTVGRMDFDDASEKDVVIEADDDIYPTDFCYVPGSNLYFAQCSFKDRTTGTIRFGISSTEPGQVDWLNANCPSWLNSGDPFVDICEYRSY